MPELRERGVPVEGSCVVLIGMPGSGKSTIGRELSAITGMAWVDTDFLMEAWWGMPLQAIRDKLGLDGFLQAEEELVSSLKFFMSIISTGGSVIYSSKAMEHLQKVGRIVYLEVDLNTVRTRLTDENSRGLAKRQGQKIDDIFEERIPLYESYAQLTVNTVDNTPQLSASLIADWMKDKGMIPLTCKEDQTA
ncbi:homoserine kinase [Desulfonatronovibrio magnus]|uniref:homoserine kinase n=1 Tax=Desulfonatronovibrio magnus TaxID=698827 RepID=UPI0005EB35AD|nr:homoserine kinase [Desulfonatronovibrio magnus]